jgi:hypothetical protein
LAATDTAGQSRSKIAQLRLRHYAAIALIFCILVTAALIRFAHIGRFELWLDECCTVTTITNPAGVFADLRLDNNPPLYFLLLKGWSGLFGTGEAGLRSFSAVSGVLQIALLVLFLFEIGMRPGTMIFAAVFACISPVHWYYSREARPYMLLLLLTTAAAWAFVRAIKSSRLLDYIVFALIAAAGLYTHDLFIPALIGILAFSMALLPGRIHWRNFAIAGVTCGIGYLPWLLHVVKQPKGEALAWVADAWRATPPALAIPRSLEAFMPGGMIPAYLPMPQPSAALRSAAIAFEAALAILLLWRILYGSSARRKRLVSLFVLMLLPLLLLFAYSVVRQPIYLVGRYDLIGLAGCSGLVGAACLAAWRLLQRLSRAASLAVPAVLVVLGTFSLYPAIEQTATGLHANLESERGELLASKLRTGDLLIATGLEGAKVAYQMIQNGLDCDLITFPLDTRAHFGWLDRQYFLPGGRDKLNAQAMQIVSMIGRGRKYPRAWLLYKPHSKPGILENTLLEQARNWRVQSDRESNTTSTARLQKLGTILLQ